jgi:hypothetical protein
LNLDAAIGLSEFLKDWKRFILSISSWRCLRKLDCMAKLDHDSRTASKKNLQLFKSSHQLWMNPLNWNMLSTIHHFCFSVANCDPSITTTEAGSTPRFTLPSWWPTKHYWKPQDRYVD